MKRGLTQHQTYLLDVLRERGPSTTPELFDKVKVTWPYGRLTPVLHALEAKGLAAHAGTDGTRALLWWATTKAVDLQYREPTAAPSTADIITAAERAIDSSIDALRASIARSQQQLADMEARRDARRRGGAST